MELCETVKMVNHAPQLILLIINTDWCCVEFYTTAIPFLFNKK